MILRQINTLALTPPMGWNSWDCYGPTVREDEVKANADFISRFLKKHGWQYMVIDGQWSEPKAKAHGYNEFAPLVMDSYGRLTPALNRFPSASGGRGFKPIADYIHDKGLKFGIHIMRGIPRQAVKQKMPVKDTPYTAADIADTNSICQWLTDMYGLNFNHPGAQAYVDSIIKLYVRWGVDYIKCDDMFSSYHKEEIELLRKALDKYAPHIVLSLSPGPAPIEQAKHLQNNANLWRISGDFWDNWSALKEIFGLCERWAPHISTGHWPDADMLPLGHIGIRAERGDDRMSLFTKDEQITVMTLWSIFKSPLIFGGDLPTSDEWTISLITNSEVLSVNQTGQKPRLIFNDGEKIAWMSDVANSKDKYIALFNLNEEGKTTEVVVEFDKMGLSNCCSARDLWKHSGTGIFKNKFSQKINAHGAGLYRLNPK